MQDTVYTDGITFASESASREGEGRNCPPRADPRGCPWESQEVKVSLSEAPVEPDTVSPIPVTRTEDAGERKNCVITSITCLSYATMLERVGEHGIPANAFVISIIDAEEEPIFAA